MPWVRSDQHPNTSQEASINFKKIVPEVEIAAELEYQISFDATATILIKFFILAAIVINFILTARIPAKLIPSSTVYTSKPCLILKNKRSTYRNCTHIIAKNDFSRSHRSDNTLSFCLLCNSLRFPPENRKIFISPSFSCPARTLLAQVT